MSTELHTEPRPRSNEEGFWGSSAESAPSQVRADEPTVVRAMALVSFSLLVLGGFIVVMHSWDRVTLLGPAWGQLAAATTIMLGLGGLLFHAARDGDQQVRRAYMAVSYLLLVAAAACSLIPFGSSQVGDWFLPLGLPFFVLGLLFQLAYLRHETDEFFVRMSHQVLGGTGAVLALWGFLKGSISITFLLPTGLVLVFLGLLFLAAFISREGVSRDLGYLVALGVGALGGLVSLIALGRAALISWGFLDASSGYQLMPGGIVLLLCGLLYLAVSAAYCSDNPLVVLTQREFIKFFCSPIAYFLLLLFTGVGWILFLQFLFRDLWNLNLHQPESVVEPAISTYIIDWWPIISVVFLVPVITMGMLSEEQRTGTLEVLLTSPVNEPTIVVSKLLASWAFFVLIWLPWGVYLIALRVEGGQPFDFRPLLGFFMALVFTSVNFLSMGIFFSSVTRNQIVAAALTFVGMLFLLLIFFLKRMLPGTALQTILTHIGFIDMWFQSLQGKVAPRDLLLHSSFALFWTFVTVKVLESRKWR